MNDILFGFKEHLKVLNRSSATVELYCEQAKAFLDAAGTDVKAVTRTKLEAHIAALYDHRTKEGKPYKPGTISVKVRSIIHGQAPAFIPVRQHLIHLLLTER